MRDLFRYPFLFSPLIQVGSLAFPSLSHLSLAPLSLQSRNSSFPKKILPT